MKTRSGDTIKLMELIDEAKNSALKEFAARKESENKKVQTSMEEM